MEETTFRQPVDEPVNQHTWQNRVRRYSTLGPLVMLVVLVLIVGAIEPSFLTIGSFQALATDAALFVLLAAGQTLVVIIGGIDLSVAALTSFMTVLLALWLSEYGPLAPIAILLLAATIGAVQGYIHAVTQVPSFILTLGGMGIWGSFALMASQASTVPVLNGMGSLAWLTGSSAGIPNGFLIALVVAALGWSVLRWLPMGRWLIAVGSAERAAVVAGASATRVRVFAFGASGMSAALAAMLLVAHQQSGAPTMADALLLPSIAAVVLGGTVITGGSGGLPQTVIGALIITVLRVGMSIMGIGPLYQQIVYGVFLILAIVVTVDRSKASIVK